MWPLAPAGFPGGGGGEFVCEAARLGLGGGSGRMRRRVLCGCWARLAFPRAREKKALVVVVAKIEAACQIELLPACPWLTAGRRPEWRPRRASMVSGGAAPGERALHACDPSEACKREPCPRPLMLPASIAIVRRLVGRALAAAAVPGYRKPGSTVAEGWHARKVSAQCSAMCNAPPHSLN